MRTIRLAFRNLLRTPVTTAVAVVSLALGIGANTAMFSVMDQVLWRTLPVPEPERLAFVYHPGPLQGSVSTDEGGGPSFSYPVYLGLARQQTAFTGLAAARSSGASISYANNAIRGSVHIVTGNYFEVLGVRAAMGRVLSRADDVTRGGHPVAVLSHKYWSNTMGSNPAVLNQTIVVNGTPLTIVGVAQRGFENERVGADPELFVPVAMRPQVIPSRRGERDEVDDLDNRRVHWITIFGRLKPGTTLAQAQAALDVPYRAQVEEDIKAYSTPSKTLVEQVRAKHIVLKPGKHGRGGLRGGARTPILLVLCITAVVLLIACANVANLLLARASTRSREIALRLSVGATRWQIIRQLLTESWVLAGVSGAAGLLVAVATLRLMIASVPARGGPSLTATLDVSVLLLSLGLCLATGVLFGLYPAIQASRADVASAIKDQAGQASAGGAANGFRKALTVGQMAASLALLVTAGVFGTSLLKQLRMELGLRADHLISFSVDPSLNKYTPAQTASFYERLERGLAAAPGAMLVTSTAVPVIAGSNWSENITVPGFAASRDEDNDSYMALIGPAYFRTMGTPLLAGREFTESDTVAGQPVAIVNETFADFYFKDGQAIGRVFSEGSGDKLVPVTIVGVTANAKYSSLKEKPRRVFYIPYRQRKNMPALNFYVRTAAPPERLAPQLRRVVAEIDPNLPIDNLKTMDAQLAENMAEERLMTNLVLAFAGLATVLAAIGLYGVMAFNVARRTREIGIRMAIGATGGDVRRMVLREAAWMLAVGTAGGVALAMGASRAVAAAMEEIAPASAGLYGLAAAALAVVALAAAWAPAVRATRVDPNRALHYE
ncbi:MAG: ABC transporter permease [Bryobacteraceae bacterium]